MSVPNHTLLLLHQPNTPIRDFIHTSGPSLLPLSLDTFTYHVVTVWSIPQLLGPTGLLLPLPVNSKPGSVQLYAFFALKPGSWLLLVSQSTHGLLPQQGPSYCLEIMDNARRSLFLFLLSTVCQISLVLLWLLPTFSRQPHPLFHRDDGIHQTGPCL